MIRIVFLWMAISLYSLYRVWGDYWEPFPWLHRDTFWIFTYYLVIIANISRVSDPSDMRNTMKEARSNHFVCSIYLWIFRGWSIWGNEWSKCKTYNVTICFCFFFRFFLRNKTVHIKTSDIVCSDTQVFMWYGLFHKLWWWRSKLILFFSRKKSNNYSYFVYCSLVLYYYFRFVFVFVLLCKKYWFYKHYMR